MESCQSITCYDGSVRARVRALEAQAATASSGKAPPGSKPALVAQRTITSLAHNRVESHVTKGPTVKSRNRNKCHQEPHDHTEATSAAVEASRLQPSDYDENDAPNSTPNLALGKCHSDINTASQRSSSSSNKPVDLRNLSPFLNIKSGRIALQPQGHRPHVVTEIWQTGRDTNLSEPEGLDVPHIPETSPTTGRQTVKARVKAIEEGMPTQSSNKEFHQPDLNSNVLDKNPLEKCSSTKKAPEQHALPTYVNDKQSTNVLKTDHNDDDECSGMVTPIKKKIDNHRPGNQRLIHEQSGSTKITKCETNETTRPRAGGLASSNPSREFVQECVHALEAVKARVSSYLAPRHAEKNLGTLGIKDGGKPQPSDTRDESQYEAECLASTSGGNDSEVPVRKAGKWVSDCTFTDQETEHVQPHLPTLPAATPDDLPGISSPKNFNGNTGLPNLRLEQRNPREDIDESSNLIVYSHEDASSRCLSEACESYEYQIFASITPDPETSDGRDLDSVLKESNDGPEHPAHQEGLTPRLSITESERELEHPSISRVHFHSYGEVEVGDITAADPVVSSERLSFARVHSEPPKLTLLTIGVATAGGAMKTLIPRNTKMPTKRVEAFSTFLDDQTQVRIQIFEGERFRTKHNKLLGSFTVTGIPPAPRGVARILVSFEVDAEGILTVLVKGEHAGLAAKKLQVATSSHNGGEELNTNLVKEFLQDAERNRARDEEDRMRICAKNCFESYAFRIRDWITDDQNCKRLKPSDKEKVEGAVACAIDWVLYKSWLFHCHDRLGQATEFDCKLGELKGICGPVLEKIDSLMDLDVNRTGACPKACAELQ